MPKSIRIRGGIIIVDDDFVFSRKRCWHVSKGGYIRSGSGTMLHREIMSAPDGMEVDHRNGNPLDNRRENLRICTHQQNLWNGASHRDSASKYRGVSWNASKRRWRVQIQGKYVGSFRREQDAAKAYNAAALARFGEFARPNLVPGAGIEPARA